MIIFDQLFAQALQANLHWYAAIALGVVFILAKIRSFLTRPKYSRLPILTEGEKRFYPVLLKSLPNNSIVSLKPRLADIVTIRGSKATRNRWIFQITSKHVDFVLLDPATLYPTLAIELDDKSHERRDRIARDKLVNKILNNAGVPVLHVPVTRDYSSDALRKSIYQLTTG